MRQFHWTTVPAVLAVQVTLASMRIVDVGVKDLTTAGELDLSRRTDRVVDGFAVPDGVVRWAASLQDVSTQQHFCGGSVITRYWVLTAAHCMINRPASSVLVVSGGTDLDSGDLQRRRASRAVIADYDETEKFNDLALIHLNQPAISAVRGSAADQLVALPVARSTPSAATSCWVLGWGAVRTGGATVRQLMAAQVAPVSLQQCQADYAGYHIYESMMCAGGAERDACQGDSGGPLVCARDPSSDVKSPWTAGRQLQLAGAVSWGVGCATPGLPGVYADVAAMRTWIESVIGSESPATPTQQ